MSLRTLYRASSVLMAGAIVAFLPAIGDADQYQQEEQQKRVAEKICQPATPSVAPSQCTFTTKPATVGGPCAAQGHIVTASSCSATVTTTANDKCDGEKGYCDPPTWDATSTASASEAADPSLSVGDCVDSSPTCTCKTNGTVTYTQGRKTC
ncbi:MAG: hypothetical protein ACF8XB_25545 [Planctomycetota bacterium JB042]